MTTQTNPAAPARHQTRLRLMWLTGAAIVIAIAAGAFIALTGDDTPTVTFDGETATYDGPDTFEAGLHTFVFDASAYEPSVALRRPALLRQP